MENQTFVALTQEELESTQGGQVVLYEHYASMMMLHNMSLSWRDRFNFGREKDKGNP